MGIVYLAIARRDASLAALKTIRPNVTGSETSTRRFLREAEVLQKLRHPGIVSYLDQGQQNGILHFAMDHVRAIDASRLIKENRGRLPVAAAVGVVCHVLEALAHAHDQGFVHRDVKPGNILVARRARGKTGVWVADFGLARIYQASQLSGLTLAGDIGGSLPYIAPEQILHFREASPHVDQYGAAATLYHMISGRPTHPLQTDFRKHLLAILQDDVEPIARHVPNLPQALEQAIQKALARRPEDRFANVREFRDALLPFSQPQPAAS
jgi:serine/threonine-protein kinase